jgi:hypothetical protein
MELGSTKGGMGVVKHCFFAKEKRLLKKSLS